MEPRILLLDEPTSALDPEMINEVLAVLSPQHERTRQFLSSVRNQS